jgi:septum site-determining protein MinD
MANIFQRLWTNMTRGAQPSAEEKGRPGSKPVAPAPVQPAKPVPPVESEAAVPFRPVADSVAPRRRGRVIVFTSGKGGVGKTTVSSAVAGLTAGAGHKTLVIDMDTGLRNLDLVLGVSPNVAYNLYDVLERGIDWHEAIISHDQIPNLHVLVTDQTREKEDIGFKQFEDFIFNEAARNYEYVFIDCPAGIEHGFKVAVTPADEAVIVTTPEHPAMRGAAQIAKILERMRIAPVTCIVNRVFEDFVKNKVCASPDEVEAMVGVPVSAVVPMDRVVVACGHRGLPLVLWPEASSARESIRDYAETILGHKI